MSTIPKEDSWANIIDFITKKWYEGWTLGEIKDTISVKYQLATDGREELEKENERLRGLLETMFNDNYIVYRTSLDMTKEDADKIRNEALQQFKTENNLL